MHPPERIAPQEHLPERVCKVRDEPPISMLPEEEEEEEDHPHPLLPCKPLGEGNPACWYKPLEEETLGPTITCAGGAVRWGVPPPKAVWGCVEA